MNTPRRRRWLGLLAAALMCAAFGAAQEKPTAAAAERRSAAHDSRRHRTCDQQLLPAHARGRARAQCAAADSRNGYARRPRLGDARNDPGDSRFARAGRNLCLALRLTRGERRHIPALRKPHCGDGACDQSRRCDAGADRRAVAPPSQPSRATRTKTTRRSDKDRSEPGTAMERKAVNDSVAYIRGLAELRGRNAEWAESAVRSAPRA